MPRSYAAFLAGVTILTWCVIGLAAALAATLGLAEFGRDLFDDRDIPLFGLGVVLGATLLRWAQRRRHRSSDGTARHR